MFVNSRYVVLIGRNRILGWEIPELHPQAVALPPVGSKDMPPTFSFSVDDLAPSENYPGFLEDDRVIHCERIPDWYNIFRPLSSFDFLTHHNGGALYKISSLHLSLPESE